MTAEQGETGEVVSIDIEIDQEKTKKKEAIAAFLGAMQDPRVRLIEETCTFCQCQVPINISFWIGLHLCFIAMIAFNAYYIAQEVELQSKESHDMSDMILSDRQLVLIISYVMTVFFSVCIAVQVTIVYGVYRCIGVLIKLQLIALSLQICVHIVWMVLTKRYWLMTFDAVSLCALHTFYRVYRWYKYVENGGHLDENYPFPE